MTHKTRYKVLPIPNFFLYSKNPIFGFPIEEEFPHWQEIIPTFNRDGWYYDRYKKIAWYEFDGKAWLNDRTGDFLYELQQLSARWLSKNEVKAIKTLMIYGSCPKSLYDVLHQHENNVRLNEIVRNSRANADRFLKNIKRKIKEKKNKGI